MPSLCRSVLKRVGLVSSKPKKRVHFNLNLNETFYVLPVTSKQDNFVAHMRCVYKTWPRKLPPTPSLQQHEEEEEEEESDTEFIHPYQDSLVLLDVNVQV